MVRPSANSTDKASLLTLTRVADPPFVSTVEELIPRPQQVLLMLFHEILDLADVLLRSPWLWTKRTGSSQNFASPTSRST